MYAGVAFTHQSTVDMVLKASARELHGPVYEGNQLLEAVILAKFPEASSAQQARCVAELRSRCCEQQNDFITGMLDDASVPVTQSGEGSVIEALQSQDTWPGYIAHLGPTRRAPASFPGFGSPFKICPFSSSAM
ncbi:hypothetical protein WJX84_010036 [Apatococcus fuscideae]|uniref:Uncharacterized protein n=1 Tax=Apatococcus fuscideae TaxID=2026836 RepID=A0AAW1T051_9CHLO